MFRTFSFCYMCRFQSIPFLDQGNNLVTFFFNREKPEMHVEYLFYPQDTARKPIQIP